MKSKNINIKIRIIIRLFFLVLSLSKVIGQNFDSYKINANYNNDLKTIDIEQTITFINNTNQILSEIFLNDWSSSYSSTETPLAQRLAEEFDRSFYFANKNKRGNTLNLSIKNNSIDLNWSRLKNQSDIIRVDLNKPLNPNEEILIKLNYIVKIADKRFTGYGIIDKNNVFIKDWFISFCKIIDNNWIKNSNLDLEEIPRNKANYIIKWTIPKNFKIHSNLILKSEKKSEISNVYEFNGDQYADIQFQITSRNLFKKFKKNNTYFETSLSANGISNKKEISNYARIDSFISKKIGKYPHKKIFISQIESDKNPNYDLTLLPNTISPYDKSFYHEIKVLKAYLSNYLNEKILVDRRNDYWVHEGILTYLIIDYIETFYPNLKVLGKILDTPILKTLIKKYNLSNMNYTDGFIQSYEFVLRNNDHQSSKTPKNDLIKFNDEIATPAQVGVGLKFLENYLGKDSILKSIKNLMDIPINDEQIKIKFTEHFDKDIEWFFETYLKKRNSIDLRIDNVDIKGDSMRISISEKNNAKIPFKLALIKNDQIIDHKWIESPNDNIILDKKNVNYIAINPDINFPEINHRNNWENISNRFGFKKIDFKFVKDLENPSKNQIFFNPITDFNAYDGLIFGVRFHNKTFKNRPFTLNILPLYAFKENTFVGSFRSYYNFFNENNSNYLTNLNLSGKTYHYDENSRFVTYRPSISFFFRPSNFRSNIRQKISFSWLSVKREKLDIYSSQPNYDIAILDYLYSDKGAIRYETFNSQFQFSKLFSKFSATYEYRKILKDARQISVRFFLGKFLNYSSNLNSNFFDFSLNRSTDYLFQYNYLGRSESEGIYSQQFIMSEGGFKSKFDSPFSNSLMVSTNLGISLWKWVELYSDFGVIKNSGTVVRGYYDSGIRLNLLPDFLEIYLPFHSSENQIEINDSNYLSNIRFVIELEPKTLLGLFNRKWF